MYVIAGGTGRVGSAAARVLHAEGASVRVLVRRREDAVIQESRGLGAAVVALDDRVALGAALRGCVGFFTLLPFDLTANDLDAHADRLIDAIAGAVADAGVPHVVMLSSGGADLVSGTGPISGLHRLEDALRATGTVLTALRSGHFQEKIGDVIGVARETGIYPVFAGSADVPLPMVATRDIGAAVAAALLRPPAESEVVDILGPAATEREAARLLGAALERALTVVTVPAEARVGALVDAGFRPHVAESLAELYAADVQGLLAPRGSRRIDAGTSLETTIARLVASVDRP